MTTVVEASVSQPFQPFQCLICNRRFTRHENLKRHASLHARSENKTCLSCSFCAATFSRADLRRRHTRRKHPEEYQQEESSSRRGPGPRKRDTEVDEAVEDEMQARISPSQHRQNDSSGYLHTGHEMWPMDMDQGQAQPNTQQDDSYSLHLTNTTSSAPAVDDNSMFYTGTSSTGQDFANVLREDRRVPPGNAASFQSHAFGSPPLETYDNLKLHNPQHIPDGLSPNDVPYLQDNWHPSEIQIKAGSQVYFAQISDFIPFLHPPTFDGSGAPRHLVLAMLSLAYQYSEDPECNYQPGSGSALSSHCFHRARVLTVSAEENTNDVEQSTAIVQAYLLLQICAMMYLCGNSSAYALKLHSRTVAAARSGGLMQPMQTENLASEDLNSLWHDFIRKESRRRTVLAMHQLDALWYQLLSVPRLLSHLEIKHDLPCPRDRWLAASSAQWAHRQLLNGGSGIAMPYADAIRQFLSPEPDLHTLPMFDPYGAINITQFLISSAREISGWSTMTGRLSLERFEPLRLALSALEPFVRSHSALLPLHDNALCEATWEMAMIELQIWSPSHTGGIVEGSIDRVLQQLAFLAPSYEFLIESNTAESIQPHVNWFLRYLQKPEAPETEAPWVALYAYKAFLIAWQLLKGGAAGAMDVVGIAQGDLEAARSWARSVFQRRSRQQLGKITVTCIEALDR